MPRKHRVKRSTDDLYRELDDQIELLKLACNNFDTGSEAAAKFIAVTLRVLLHSTDRSHGLLDQLGYRKLRFFDSAMPLNPNNLMTECNLIGMSLSTTSARHLPMVAMGGSPYPGKWTSFSDWWNTPVLKDIHKNYFNRRELILNVADTDGGAHVDPTLEDAYMALSRRNSIGWVFTRGGISEPLLGRPELACMRQIAHEVLITITENRES